VSVNCMALPLLPQLTVEKLPSALQRQGVEMTWNQQERQVLGCPIKLDH